MTEALARAIGDLEGTVKGLRGEITDLRTQWGQQEAAATSGRSKLHARVDELGRELATNTAVTRAMKGEVDEIKQHIEDKVMPTITAYRLELAHRAGMWLMGKLFYGLVLALAATLGFFIHEGFQYLRGAQPPAIFSPLKKP